MSKAISILSIAALVALLALVSCANSVVTSQNRQVASSPLVQTFEAHGGLDRWREYGTLEYRLTGFPLSAQVQKPNRSTVDLRGRRNRIEGEAFTVGFDGERAWSTPEADAAGLPTRFFNLGSFYFIGIPFVFADPGAVIETLPAETFRGREYHAYRVSYVSGTGYSSKDDYVVLVDPDTHQLRLIHHSVTEKDPNLRVVWLYDEWQTVEGLVVPKKLVFHADWNGGDLPAEGAVTLIDQVRFAKETPDDSTYAIPADAHVSQ